MTDTWDNTAVAISTDGIRKQGSEFISQYDITPEQAKDMANLFVVGHEAKHTLQNSLDLKEKVKGKNGKYVEQSKGSKKEYKKQKHEAEGFEVGNKLIEEYIKINNIQKRKTSDN
ncbi:hypothetical protein D3H65_25755 [Paraflavitalea soli]|uniref:Uncharacterized protein n=1 Tax=Paraflavitalea soli TaxID=2315862 RepID=A0A3B7MSS0_9BACT|nr:hypothetical protein [Paraflavitalea soli]AXY77178.1 hypothetical protein D3H65_25755 [Paraflavitalea soli]